MAVCLVPNANGYFVAQGGDPTLCPGVVSLSSQEYSAFLANTGMPGTSELSAMFSAGFVTPMTAYLIAYCVGRIVAMFDSE